MIPARRFDSSFPAEPELKERIIANALIEETSRLV